MTDTNKQTRCQWEGCGKLIDRGRKGKRFCNNKCRAQWHLQHNRRDGIPGVISSLRLLKGGKVSMVLRFNEPERGRLTAFSQGQKVKVID